MPPRESTNIIGEHKDLFLAIINETDNGKLKQVIASGMTTNVQFQIVHEDGTQTTVDVVVEKNDKVKTGKSKSKKVVFGTSFNLN